MPEAQRHRVYDQYFHGVIIVGAGPWGLAVAFFLSVFGIPYTVIEESDCVGSLWKYRTYDILKLQLPKQYCQLPDLPIPEHFPDELTNKHFSDYLDMYAEEKNIKPHCRFNERVISAKYDKEKERCGVVTVNSDDEVAEYTCFKLVVATGENAVPFEPVIDGRPDFSGVMINARDYKSGEKYKGKKVLVVGSGNSGIDISLDLSNHNAETFTVVKGLDSPQKIKPFDLAVQRKNYKPSQFEKYVDDEGTPEINAIPEIIRFHSDSVELNNGNKFKIDSVVWATGYRTNVGDWLEEDIIAENGYPKDGFQQGERGIYVAGFTGNGLLGIREGAKEICSYIEKAWKAMIRRKKMIEEDDMSGCGSFN